MHAPNLRSPRLLLRPLSEEDRPEFVRTWELSWPSFQPWVPVPTPGETTSDLFDRMLERTRDGLRQETEYRFVGFLPDGQIAAFVSLFQIVRRAAQSAMMSWSASARFQRQGYATEAVSALLDFAFASQETGLALHRVQANVIPANTRSIRVAEKNGFRREGLAIKYLQIAGQWQDHIMFAKLAEEHQPNR